MQVAPPLRLRRLVDDYLAWLRDRTQLREISDEWTEITTPYIDRHNDFLQIYVKPIGDGFVFSDDGYTLTDLEQAGCAINSPKRKQLLSDALRSFGMTEEDGSLVARAQEDDFVFRKHMFVQGLLAIGDMFYLAAPTVATLFLEDVASWMRSEDIRAVRKVKMTGKSGFDHFFDFAIPATATAPERLVKAYAKPSRDTAEAMAFAWVDTRGEREPGSKAFAILNDQEGPIPKAVTEALTAYEVSPVPWSRRGEYVEKLAA